MTHPQFTPPAPPAHFTGVHFSDAAVGEIALIVYVRGKRVIRLEIAQDYFSDQWVRWLGRWAQRQNPALRLVD